MRIPAGLGAILLVGWLGAVTGCLPAIGASAIAGTWTGESKCMVPNSPCHDEHVVYEIKGDSKAADHFTIDAYKIVAGERDFMGTLGCQYPTADNTLRCLGRRPDDVWIFTVTGDTMSGTLTVGTDKQLFRKVNVHRGN